MQYRSSTTMKTYQLLSAVIVGVVYFTLSLFSSSLFLPLPLFSQERLCLRNAELSDALAATRHSRTLLERELISLKRSHLEARSRQAQLEASLREVEREREELAERVASSEGEGRRRLREMQRQVGGRTVA